MNMQDYLQQAYAADKAAAEAAYEALMGLEESQHRQRMDAYATLRRAALKQINDKYGSAFEPTTALAPTTE